MNTLQSALNGGRRALHFVEARFSALHKLMALAVAAAIPLALAGWMSWSVAQRDIGAARDKIEALTIVDGAWRIIAEISESPSGAMVDQHRIAPYAETLMARPRPLGVAGKFHDSAAAWAQSITRPPVTRDAALATGSALLAEISTNASLTVESQRSLAWTMFISTRQLPLYMASAEQARSALASSDGKLSDPKVWKALGAFDDTSKRTLWAVTLLKKFLPPNSAHELDRSSDKMVFATDDLNAKMAKLMALGENEPAARDAALADVLQAEQEAAYAVDALYKDVSVLAHDMLDTRLREISTDRRGAAVLGLFILGLTCICAIALARSIIKPQRQLVATMERLIEGDTGVEIPYRKYKNEVGDIANAVEVFRQTLIARKGLEAKLESERAALEKRVAERTRLLEAANAEKSRFVALLSHEIRTPLNGVLGMASALSRTPLEQNQLDMLRVITASGDVLLRLLNNAIDITRIETGQFELELGAFDLGEMVEAASELYRESARAKRLSFSVKIADDAKGVYRGDGVRLRQIVQNFVANAVKFTDEGEVSVAVTRQGEDRGRISLRVDVADTGIGLPSEPSRLFQRFSQGEPSFARRYGGAGLGLAISRELAELMGATVSAHPRPAGGSIFRLEVALDLTQAPTVIDCDSPEGEIWSGVRILAADDNAMNRLVLKTLLAQAGIDVHLVENGVDAVEAARGVRFDLILLDVHMPGLDGMTATRTIRTLNGPNKDVPILALTADTLPTQVQACLAAGMNGHVAKPIQVEALFTAIADALAQSQQNGQSRGAAN